MDIRVLNYFIEVAKEGNITKASQTMNVTQPTLSRQLMQLEEELGVKLFDRGNHNIALTEEGYLFRRRAQEIVNLTNKAKGELLQVDDEVKGMISIGCSETQSMNELAQMILSFRKMHPLVTFELRSGDNTEVKDWLNQGNMDLALFIETTDVSEYSYIRLRHKDIWGVLVHKTSGLASKKKIHRADLAGEPLITIMDESIHRKLGRWAMEYAEMMVPVAHYNLLSNAVTMVKGDDGFAICAEPSCAYPDLKFIPFEPKFELGAYLVWKEEQKYSKALQTFIDFACNTKNE